MTAKYIDSPPKPKAFSQNCLPPCYANGTNLRPFDDKSLEKLHKRLLQG